MDWGRYLRAMKARRVERVEERRLVGIADPDKLSGEEWAAVAAHDALLEEMSDG